MAFQGPHWSSPKEPWPHKCWEREGSEIYFPSSLLASSSFVEGIWVQAALDHISTDYGKGEGTNIQRGQSLCSEAGPSPGDSRPVHSGQSAWLTQTGPGYLDVWVSPICQQNTVLEEVQLTIFKIRHGSRWSVQSQQGPSQKLRRESEITSCLPRKGESRSLAQHQDPCWGNCSSWQGTNPCRELKCWAEKLRLTFGFGQSGKRTLSLGVSRRNQTSRSLGNQTSFIY